MADQKTIEYLQQRFRGSLLLKELKRLQSTINDMEKFGEKRVNLGKKNGLVISKRFEIFMQKDLKESRDKK